MSSIPSARKRRAIVACLATLAGGLAVALTQGAQAAPPAAYTGTNSADPGAGPCLNGPGDINCNIYTAKKDVWLNAGPLGTAGGFGPGTYFWVVLEPGGGVNDGDAGNLSDDVDPYTDRTFVVSATGDVSYSRTHDVDGTGAGLKVRLGLAADYFGDTGNPGGEYRIAICRLDAPGFAQPVGSNACKRDNFKIDTGGSPNPGGEIGLPLTVTKNATALYDEDVDWTLTKAASTLDAVTGQSVGYTVTATHSPPERLNPRLTGELEVSNPNDVPVTLTTLTDNATLGATTPACTVYVDDARTTVATTPIAVDPGETVFPYTCIVTGTTDGTNSAAIAWSAIDTADIDLPAGTATDAVPVQFGLDERTDACLTVGDAFDGGTADKTAMLCDDGTVSALPVPTLTFAYAPPTFTATYPRTMPNPGVNTCRAVGNTFSGLGSSGEVPTPATATVSVCATVTGGHTIGFWQNKNGQGLIKGAGPATGTCSLTGTLRGYAPFEDLGATATCAAVATYVTNVIKAASAAGPAMNPMLKAQMLATALSVEFTKASRPNAFFPPVTLGGVRINTTRLGADAAFGVTPPAYKTVAGLLGYAASKSNVGGTDWYGQDKAVQGQAKDTFDAINNEVAVVAP